MTKERACATNGVLTNDRCDFEYIQSKSATLMDLLCVIEHLEDHGAQQGLSASVIDAAKHSATLIAELAGKRADEIALAEARNPSLSQLMFEYQAILEAAEKHVPTSTGKAVDDELDRLFYNRANQIAKKMMAIPSVSPADFAAKLIVDTAKGGLVSDWHAGEIWKEARALTGCAE